MKTSISAEAKAAVMSELQAANRAFYTIYPGDSEARQPVHTVYGGANLFKFDTTQKMSGAALKTLKEYAPDFITFAKVLELPGHEKLPDGAAEKRQLLEKLQQLSSSERKQDPAWLTFSVYEKTIAKLEQEAVEDFRIDFEDGFGNRSDEEEDQTAEYAALETAKGMEMRTLSPFIGIRIRPFTEELKERGARTLDIYLTTLLQKTGGKLPENFVVMLPKVSIPDQIKALVKFLGLIEKANGIPNGTIKMEIMVETTQAIMNSDGKNPLRSLLLASEGRMVATAFGTYDYTASCGITARYQNMGHPVCDFAHHMTKVALAHTGLWLADGATNVMPVGPHRGADLSSEQLEENKKVVHNSWKIAYDHVRHSLWNGYYQGWDLHPAQLPIRYAAVYSFFLESYEQAALRLRNFVEQSARATLSGDIFDDAATGQGLLNYFLKAINCGAISEQDALATGLTIEEIRVRSFANILENRRNN